MGLFIGQLAYAVRTVVIPITLITPTGNPSLPMATPSLKPTYTIGIQSTIGNTSVQKLTFALVPTPSATPIKKPRPKDDQPLADTPLPTKTPPRKAPENLEALFTKYSKQYGIDGNKFKQIAHCESTFHPDATNGDYGGLYQFSTSTWQSTRKSMGLDPNPDLRFDAEEAIKTAAYKMSLVGFSPWPTCGK